jgi:Fur family peroxide stress response transcriptional regulator
MTPQRIAILKVVLSSDDHPTVEKIHETVQNDFPMTSLATVYNTLTLLRELGIVHEIPGHGGAGSRFDGFHEEAHPHLICEVCGSLSDMDAEMIKDLNITVEKQTGYSNVNHNLVFRGVCPSCNSLHEES